jgi:prephenate dehydrogenase
LAIYLSTPKNKGSFNFQTMIEQITILGPGLLGASLAMAVKENRLATRVVTWSRRPETRAKCSQQSWCDAVFESPEEAVAGSEFIVICTPVETIAPLLTRIAHTLAEGALVTDVGSTKSFICRAARSALAPTTAAFIGSHPMAGSEHAGMEHARADLFASAACILTPLKDAPPAAIAQLRAFWEALGMSLSTASPEEHDEIVAHISHLPHLLASTLCSHLAGKDPVWQNLAGGGLRDTTRVASGDPSLWKQILQQNSDEVLRAINGFEEELHQLKSALLNKDSLAITSILERGKNYRDRLR